MIYISNTREKWCIVHELFFTCQQCWQSRITSLFSSCPSSSPVKTKSHLCFACSLALQCMSQYCLANSINPNQCCIMFFYFWHSQCAHLFYILGVRRLGDKYCVGSIRRIVHIVHILGRQRSACSVFTHARCSREALPDTLHTDYTWVGRTLSARSGVQSTTSTAIIG